MNKLRKKEVKCKGKNVGANGEEAQGQSKAARK